MSAPPVIQWVADNIGLTRCQTYFALYSSAYGAAFRSFFTGQFWLTGGLALLGRAFELSAQRVGCSLNPFEPEQPPYEGCQKWSSGNGQYVIYKPDGSSGPFADYVEIFDVISRPEASGSNWILKIIYQRPDGSTTENIYNDQLARRTAPFFFTRPVGDAVCGEPAPEPTLPEHDPGEPISDPVTYTDPSACNWTIQATDSYVNDQGEVVFYYTVTSDDPETCGGPFAYWDDGKDEPHWVTDPGNDPGGNPYSPPPAPDYNPRFDDIDKELDDIKKELDAIKECACDDPKPELLGDWVSIRFVSDGISPGGTNPLRKLFRYRSQSSRTEQQLRDYWAGFTWQAGPVIVQHKGTWWGTPQVWASSAEEGKRVLRFAAGEAGAAPDTDGEWIVTGSASPRYGMSGTMRVQQYRGRDWVTSRIGPSGPVEL